MSDVIKKTDTFISTVLILDDVNIDDFETYLKSLQHYLNQRFSDYEIIIIDQGRAGLTAEVQSKLLGTISSIRWIKLAFPVEIEVAMCAGTENAIGDYLVLLRPTIDPVEIVGNMIKEMIGKYDVIVGIAKVPKSTGYKLVRTPCSKLLRSVGYHIPKNATPVRCLSRRAINAVLNTRQLNHQFFARVAKTGYPTKGHKYVLLNSETLKKKTLISGITQTYKTLIFNSTKPLQWASVLGMFGCTSAFLFAVYSILIKYIRGGVVEGWTSMVLFSSALFFILFVILTFLGEYLARLLNESNNQKNYFISGEETSHVMLDVDRLNVREKSQRSYE